LKRARSRSLSSLPRVESADFAFDVTADADAGPKLAFKKKPGTSTGGSDHAAFSSPEGTSDEAPPSPHEPLSARETETPEKKQKSMEQDSDEPAHSASFPALLPLHGSKGLGSVGSQSLPLDLIKAEVKKAERDIKKHKEKEPKEEKKKEKGGTSNSEVKSGEVKPHHRKASH